MNVIVRHRGFRLLMSFLDTLGGIMSSIGLEELWNTAYNIPHLLQTWWLTVTPCDACDKIISWLQLLLSPFRKDKIHQKWSMYPKSRTIIGNLTENPLFFHAVTRNAMTLVPQQQGKTKVEICHSIKHAISRFRRYCQSK